jgi:hypothetical protein
MCALVVRQDLAHAVSRDGCGERPSSPVIVNNIYTLQQQAAQQGRKDCILGSPWEHTHPQQDDSHGKS